MPATVREGLATTTTCVLRTPLWVTTRVWVMLAGADDGAPVVAFSPAAGDGEVVAALPVPMPNTLSGSGPVSYTHLTLPTIYSV